MSEPFFFGVPLIARSVAHDWGLVDHLLGLTLRSVLAQSDPDFRLFLAGHGLPPCWELVEGDPRFAFVEVHWPPEPPNEPNDDGGHKKLKVKERVRDAGAGLLMFLDADDLVDRDLVRVARAEIGPEQIGGLVADGIALDLPTLRAVPFPITKLWDRPFHSLCGSSTVARIDPTAPDWLHFDPHKTLGSHGDWEESARRLGVRLAMLPVRGAYLVGTGQSHSEHDGPFAAWRRRFAAGVRERGQPLTPEMAARFGLSLSDFERVTEPA